MSSRSIDGGGHNRSRIGRPLEDDDCSSKKAFRFFVVVVAGKNRPVCLVPLTLAHSRLNRHFIVRKLRERRGASSRQKYERGERKADEENPRLAHSTQASSLDWRSPQRAPKITFTASLSHLRTMLPKSSSYPKPAQRPNHAT